MSNPWAPVPRIAFVGYSGAGKTSMLERVARVLTAKGLRIAFLKANAHRIDLDREGKDTHRLQDAGAVAVAIEGQGGSVIFSPPTPRTSSSLHPHELAAPTRRNSSSTDLDDVTPANRADDSGADAIRPLPPSTGLPQEPVGAVVDDWEDFEARAALWDLEVALPEVDLILIEGMKHSPWPKIVIDRADNPRGRMGIDEVRNVILHLDWPKLPESWDESVTLATQAIEREIERHAAPANAIVGAVLAGGVSRRMGRDKVRLPVRDTAAATWLERNLLLLAELVREPWIIGRIIARGGQDAPSLRRVPRSHLDLRQGAGPLAGLETALRLARADSAELGVPQAVLAIPCDLPGLGVDVLRHLLEERGTAPALAFRRADGHREPAVVLIESTAASEVERALDVDDNAVVSLLERVGVRWLELPTQWEWAFENINDPDSLARWSERSRRKR